MKDKNVLQLLMLFKKSNEANFKLNKRLNGSKFHNRPMKSWLQNVNIEIIWTHNEGKPAFGERFIRTLNNKIYK